MAVASLVAALAEALCEENWAGIRSFNKVPTSDLHEIFLATLKDAENTEIDNMSYLSCFGIDNPCKAKDIWHHCFLQLKDLIPQQYFDVLTNIYNSGTLATRISRLAGTEPSTVKLRTVAGELVGCLSGNRLFY